MSIELKSPAEIASMRHAGKIVANILEKLAALVKPGIRTSDLDDAALEMLKSYEARPAFLGYRGFPKTLCVSINSEVVHGIPRPSRLVKSGDVVSLDFGCVWNGFYGDAALTVGVAPVSREASRLIETARRSLDAGIAAMRLGGRVGDISNAVQEDVESNGFSVVRDFVGHGIGRALHEEPQVPNFGKSGTGPRIETGMVLAIEPMVAAGSGDVEVLADGWTAVTRDGGLAAHFEHTVAMTDKGAEILTLSGPLS